MTKFLDSAVFTTARSTFKKWDQHVLSLWGILLVLLVFFLIVKPAAFTRLATWQSMFVQFPEFGIMALGVMLAMITGGIDLSVVGIANLSGIAAALTMVRMTQNGGSMTVAVAAAIAVALLCGLLAGILNGVLVAKVKIPAILVTLGTLELFSGVAIVLSAGRPISGLPTLYSQIIGGKVAGVIPVPLIIFIVVAVGIAVLLNKTTYGTELYLYGTNATAAKFSGLPLTKLLIKTYVLSGLCASIAGLVMLANYNSAKADYGVAYTLLTILIVVLGGVNPNGGSGRISGVILAIVILQVLSSGLNMFPNISNFYRPLIWGGVLLFVIATSDLKGMNPFKRFKKGA